jgi:hypothetical protein
MDEWDWEQLRPWLSARAELRGSAPAVPLCPAKPGPTEVPRPLPVVLSKSGDAQPGPPPLTDGGSTGTVNLHAGDPLELAPVSARAA